MDKNAIKKFAVWARRELIARVSQKAAQYGIEEHTIVDGDALVIGERVLSAEEIKQRQALIAQVNEKGYEQVMEEVAYTWFNRFIALRFMEVNNYLPSHVRVFTDEDDRFKPQILTEAIHLDFDGLNMETVYALKETNANDALYRYLLITQCNALNKILPKMFQRIADYTELLLPDNLLREGSVIEQMLTQIPQQDWQDAVQIIGWLYQYYNAEKKDVVFAALKKNVKITKENIPAATQLFTPDWIVRYMVENSLGRLWVEGHPNNDLKANWKYYLEEAEQEPEVQAQLAEIRKEYAAMKPEDITCIDPCCGSGHILAYLFDVLMQIYESYGYTSREAVENIIQHNLYGLDIDDRAAQLAYFAVMMKARQYDRRFFSRQLQPNIYAIQESNSINSYLIDYFCNGDPQLKAAITSILDDLHDAKEYGSILTISPMDFAALYARFDQIWDDISMYKESVLNNLLPLVQVAEILAKTYEVVVTNPPYMRSSNMGAKLSNYVKKHYPDSKSDLFAVFIETCGQMTKENGYQAMITQHAWMFLSSFEKLRTKLLQKDIINMAHLGARAFDEISGEVVQTTSFVQRNSHLAEYQGIYCRLIEPTTQQGKEDMFLLEKNRYITKQSNFSKILGSPVAYWVSDRLAEVFYRGTAISKIGSSRSGMQTGNNELFLRFWFEVNFNKIKFDMNSDVRIDEVYEKWFPQPKGGPYRKWFGNLEYIVNYESNGRDLKEYPGTSIIKNPQYYFKEGVTWSHTTSKTFSGRYMPKGCIFNVEAPTFYPINEMYLIYVLAFVNTKILDELFGAISQTMHYMAGDMAKIPVILCSDEKIQKIINSISCECISISKADWDSFETSWDFKKHPLIRLASTVADAFAQWEAECEERFQQLKANEKELNRIFIDIYGLQDELTPEVEDKDVTVYRIFDERSEIPDSMGSSKYALTKQDVVKSLISYAVGCMFGRYSLDVDGLVYAGGEWDSSKYVTYPADKDNIIPICDDEYFDDDIVGRFVKFIEVVYGKETLEDNLKFIADALGGKGQPKDVIRNYFLKDFYKDHCKTYQKCPIYWLFDSGKKNGFKALIYMHRYQPDTIARIRTDYVHEQQARYRTAIDDIEQRLQTATSSDRVKLNKALKKLTEQDIELRTYEEKIHHLADKMTPIDLDDGVKKNYDLFQDVLAKIK